MPEQHRYLEEFINIIDVECPTCNSRALVVSDHKNRSNTRFTCSTCGRNKEWSGEPGYFQTSGPDLINSKAIALGKPFDCYFKLPLWYMTSFRGNTFFAYNREHLAFQKEYIKDPLRKRSQNDFGWSNASLQSRLPKWMLIATNRDGLLKKISALENK
jgi:DNA-directed RNA polymerase subunit RPC12/RpoP